MKKIPALPKSETSYSQPVDSLPVCPVAVRFPSPAPRVITHPSNAKILVRGENVFLGYYKDQEATDQTLVDGWLHSGDLGRFDDDGFLRIIGRKKEIIITAGGKNIAPKNIEAALRDISLISQNQFKIISVEFELEKLCKDTILLLK